MGAKAIKLGQLQISCILRGLEFPIVGVLAMINKCDGEFEA